MSPGQPPRSLRGMVGVTAPVDELLKVLQEAREDNELDFDYHSEDEDEGD